MNKNTVYIALLALLLGAGVGMALGHHEGMMMQDTEVTHNNSQSMPDEMDGMMSGLSGKTGDAFDQAFLVEMITHHEGAVAMAQAALTNAQHDEIKTMAREIISAQTAEIAQMQSWQKAWYGK